MNKNIKRQINEASSDGSGGRGSYVAPMQPGIRIFKKSDMQPFNIPVSKYDNAMLEYDSYDGSMDEPKKQIKNLEDKSKKISKYMEKHPNLTASDEDGNNINQSPGKKLKIVPIKENTKSSNGGEYNGPIELGLKKWKKSELFPFINQSTHKTNKNSKSKNVKNNINRVVGVWEKGVDGTYDIDIHDVHTVNEWIEITQDTISEDLISSNTLGRFNKIVSGKPLNINQNKKSQNESLRDLIKKVLSENTKTI